MRDLDIERHLRWMHACVWVKTTAFVLAIFMFIMFAIFGLSDWVWWAAWPTLGVALAARTVGEHHHREFQELLRRSYLEPWWLGIDQPLQDWRDR